MKMRGIALAAALALATAAIVTAEDPYLFFTWKVTYGTISPMGFPQRGILINGEFPGPNINSTTNNNVVVNVFNGLDEPFLLTWAGVQHRKNSWQDGVQGTNCPILPGTNYTYRFQVKDQIGSFFYYPSMALHRASGGFGGLRVNSRLLIPVPYSDPEDDYTVLIGDWYSKGHVALRRLLEGGRALGRPDGVLINGKAVGSSLAVKPGKTYKLRICNVGIKDSLNFRIQGHPMTVVEMEGSHTVQNTYDSLDVHLGQCFSVLLHALRNPGHYSIVASTRFTKRVLSAHALLRYVGAPARTPPPPKDLPGPPPGWAWSLSQFRSFRWNLTASAARPNPQGSYHYGKINITRTIKLTNSVSRTGGKLRYGINGVSHVDGTTPLKLAEYFGAAAKAFRYDDALTTKKTKTMKIAPSVVKQEHRKFVEIVFENSEKSVQSWNLDGYAFFAVAVEPGKWSPEKRRNYNLQDAVSRHTVQVFPKSWAAVLLSFDNAGMWNLRSETAENRYLGQQLYVSVESPARSLRDEYNIPDSALLCGLVTHLPKPPPYTI